MESGFQIVHAAAVEAHDVTDARQMSDKNPVSLVKLDVGAVALVKHRVHGVIPISCKNLRASDTL